MNEKTVLIVEDDESLCTLFYTLLGRYGFTTVLAKNGAEALDRLAQRPYDVVVLDLMMPVSNGFDVLRHFSETTPALLRRTIVTTGVADRILNTIDGNSVFAVIRKPFDIDHLVETVQACARPVDSGEELHREASQRFDAVAPELREILRDACASPEETLLRKELRAVVSELGTVLETAARSTANAVLSHGFTRMATTARELARMTGPGTRRDH